MADVLSTRNERVQLARSLMTQTKARRDTGRMALEGVRLIRDALHAGLTPDYVLIDQSLAESASGDLRLTTPPGWPLLTTTPEIIRHISETEHPQGMIGVFAVRPPPLPNSLRRVLILDALRDPGNAGTILRSAAAAGVDVVLCAPGTVDVYNPKVLRAGMGAHFRVPVLEASWTRIAILVEALTVYLADMTGDVAYHAADWSQPWALIIGGEADGESPQAAQLAGQRVFIPMSRETESLNAAAAASVLLFEARRATGK